MVSFLYLSGKLRWYLHVSTACWDGCNANNCLANVFSVHLLQVLVARWAARQCGDSQVFTAPAGTHLCLGCLVARAWLWRALLAELLASLLPSCIPFLFGLSCFALCRFIHAFHISKNLVYQPCKIFLDQCQKTFLPKQSPVQ